MDKINIGIVGYGNLGKGVEQGVLSSEDMNLFGIFSRRDPKTLDTSSPAYLLDDILAYKEKIDVLILCGGSAKDIPVQGPELSKNFNTVDAYDNHDLMARHYKAMDESASSNNNTSIIGTGWDPGLFSLNRLIGEAVLPQGETFTFWGKGVSQGHSDAIRKIDGVKHATQYTLPNEEMVEDIRNGKAVDYQGKTSHKRDCYVVIEEGANEENIEEEILTMPDYFLGYETRVTFIDEDEYLDKHKAMSHGGKVIRRGKTDENKMSVYEFSLSLDSNPQFTSLVNIAFARACYRLNQKDHYGAYTVADVPPALLSPRDRDDIIENLI